MPLIPTLGRQRQEDFSEFQALHNYTVRPVSREEERPRIGDKAGETAKQSRALAALLEDPGSVPSGHIWHPLLALSSTRHIQIQTCR